MTQIEDVFEFARRQAISLRLRNCDDTIPDLEAAHREYEALLVRERALYVDRTAGPNDAIHRLKTVGVVSPDEHSTTQFVPFVQIDAHDRDVLVTYIEAHEIALANAIADCEGLVTDRRAFRIEILEELATMTDAGITLDSAALRELAYEVRRATERIG